MSYFLSDRKFRLWFNPICLLILAGLFFASCQKEDQAPEGGIDKPIIDLSTLYQLAPDGVLTFNDQVSFDQFYTYLMENPKSIKPWRQSMAVDNFTSLNTTFRGLTEGEQVAISEHFIETGAILPPYDKILVFELENSGEYDVQKVVGMPVIQDIVTIDGVYRIGEKSVIYNRNFRFSGTNLSPAEEIQIAKLNGPRAQDLFPDLEINEITRTMYQSFNSERVIWDSDDEEYRPDRRRRRVKGDVRNVNSGNRMLVGRTRHQRYIFPAWWARNTDEVRLQMTGSITWGAGTPDDFDIDDSALDDNEFQVAASSCVAFCLGGNGSFDATHSADCEDGTWRQVTTSGSPTDI